MPESERQRIAKMARERVYTDEIRRNMSLAHTGYVMPKAQRDKIAVANTGNLKARCKHQHINRGLPCVCGKH